MCFYLMIYHTTYSFLGVYEGVERICNVGTQGLKTRCNYDVVDVRLGEFASNVDAFLRGYYSG